MSIEVSVAIAVFIFAVLAVFIIITLVRFNKILKDVQCKTKRLNSIVNAMSNLGEVCENKTMQLKVNSLNQPINLDQGDNYYPELASLILLSLKLGEKFLKNRG